MAQVTGDDGKPRCIFVFDNMRARSHVFFRWLSTSPELEPIYHPYILSSVYGRPDSFLWSTKNSEARHKENLEQLATICTDESIDDASQNLKAAIAKAQAKGKIPFANEHCLLNMKHDILLEMIRSKASDPVPAIESNPSLLPDEWFNTITPIIVIRNPLFQIPSIYESFKITSQCRPGDEDFALASSAKTYRLLFEVLRSQGRTPTVVDGDDVLTRTTEVAEKVCAAVGIDPAGVVDTWEPIPASERPVDNPVIVAWTTTIWESSGIDRIAVKDAPTMDGEYKKWVEKYGTEVATSLKEYVEASMPHYEHLMKFKV